MTWITALLGEITTVLSGTTPDSSNPAYWNGNNVWVTPTDLGKLCTAVITTSSRLISEEGRASCNPPLIPRGAVIMSSRAPIGHLALAGCDLHTNQGCKSFVCSNKLDSEFLYFNFKYRMADIQSLGSGATFIEVSKSALENFEINFPDNIYEQRQIAASLKAQLAEVGTARQAAQQQLREIKLALNQIIEAQIARSISSSGNFVKLGKVSTITAKLVQPEHDNYGDLPHVSAENIESLTGRLLNIRSAKEDGMTSGKYLFDAGDILYSKLRPYLRKVAKPDFDGLCSADMYPIKADESALNIDFLKLLLTSNFFTDYANEKSARSRMPKLNREQLFDFEFKLPTLNAQEKCVTLIRSALMQLEQASAAAKCILKDIELLPKRILAQAFEV